MAKHSTKQCGHFVTAVAGGGGGAPIKSGGTQSNSMIENPYENATTMNSSPAAGGGGLPDNTYQSRDILQPVLKKPTGQSIQSQSAN